MSAIRTLTCPACSAPLEPGTSVCPYCDTPLAIRVAPEAVDAEAIVAAWQHAELSELRAAAARRPIDPAANYALGIAYSRLGLWDDALDPFRTAAEKMPENPDFQYAIAAALHELVLRGDNGRNRWVQDRIERALAVDPDHVRTLALVAHRDGRIGNTDAMMASFARLVEASPENGATMLASFIERNQDHGQAALLARPPRERVLREAASATRQTKQLAGCAGLAGIALVGTVVSYGAAAMALPVMFLAILLIPILAWAALELRRRAAVRRADDARTISPQEADLLVGRGPDAQELLAFAGEVVRAIPPGGPYMPPGRPTFPP